VKGKVAAVGYCWGGSAAYLGACHASIQAAVCYYGTRILQFLDRTPQCPVMYHFGETDASIPPDKIETIKEVRPEGIFHVYPGAGHGFNCDERASYDEVSAALAFQRTLEFLNSKLNG
jgi:carboxymethylenebutenolidase